MNLMEYQAQKLFSDSGISVPHGNVASDSETVYEIVKNMKSGAVIKAQVLSGGRGKSGGVRKVSSPEEALTASRDIFKMKLGGFQVKKVLVAPVVEIKKEYYISLVLNRSDKRIDCIFCDQGGVDIEETAVSNPEKIRIIPVNEEIIGEGKDLVNALNEVFGDGISKQVLPLVGNMYSLFMGKDCLLEEINPLALDADNELVALDAKITIDDNALYKHPELDGLRNEDEYGQDEIDAKKASLVFIGLDGDIGCMVNGAGLAMATMDLIKYYGGEPANFLDIGGSSNPEKVVNGLHILLRKKKIRSILLNIFGGITRCDDIALGLVRAQKESRINVPLVIRLIGTNDREGIELLQKNGFEAFANLSEAVKIAVYKSSIKGAV